MTPLPSFDLDEDDTIDPLDAMATAPRPALVRYSSSVQRKAQPTSHRRPITTDLVRSAEDDDAIATVNDAEIYQTVAPVSDDELDAEATADNLKPFVSEIEDATEHAEEALDDDSLFDVLPPPLPPVASPPPPPIAFIEAPLPIAFTAPPPPIVETPSLAPVALAMHASQISIPTSPSFARLAAPPTRSGGSMAIVIVAAALGVLSLAGALVAAVAFAPRTPTVAAPPAVVTTTTRKIAEPAKVAEPAKSVDPAPLAVASLPDPVTAAVPSDSTFVTFPTYARGHRIFVDGKAVLASGGVPANLKCGHHAIKVGSAGHSRDLDLPCGAAITLP